MAYRAFTALLTMLVLAVAPQAARANWHVASSDHFVIYADMPQQRLRATAERLERYSSAMELVTGQALEKPSPSNRLTVYFVRGIAQVQQLQGDGNKRLAGFYLPRAVGPLAFVPADEVAEGGTPVVLLHEYAHHFLISSSSLPTPRWVGEGAAEFYASSEFRSNGGLYVGLPAQHREYELFTASEVGVEELFDPAKYAAKNRKGYNSFYGKSWLLYHYLTFNPERRGQLKQYLTAIANGTEQVEAARGTFGDFATLERELDKYMKSRIAGLQVPPDKLRIGEIAVRPLDDAEAAILPVTMRSRRGVDKTTAADVLAAARAVAAKCPKSAAVQSELSEAAFDAGELAAAVAAADAAIAADPTDTRAYLQKGLALFAVAEDKGYRQDAIDAAMAPMRALNAIENDHTQPLIWYYRSFGFRGVQPTPLAVTGLRRAVELAPFDLGLRMTAGMRAIYDHDLPLAKWLLRPVAFSPHGGSLAASAQAALARAEQEPTWRGEGLIVMPDVEVGSAD